MVLRGPGKAITGRRSVSGRGDKGSSGAEDHEVNFCLLDNFVAVKFLYYYWVVGF